MTVISMSRSEIDRMTVLRDLAEDRIRVSEAATLMGLGRRQVFRLAKAFQRRGPVALASRRRGQPSNRSYPSVLRTEVIGIIRERYADFGPTLAGEKLTELHGIELARETIRQWMMVAGLWKDRGQRLKPVHQPRHRRDCVGELIQIDGSNHWWFEARGPRCTLLVYIDDSTSRLMHLQFVETESTFDYFVLRRAAYSSAMIIPSMGGTPQLWAATLFPTSFVRAIRQRLDFSPCCQRNCRGHFVITFALNERGVRPARGTRWYVSSVSNLLARAQMLAQIREPATRSESHRAFL
jgi:hypothetical protein